MSGWEFFNSSNPKARKEYVCQWCNEPILVGEQHHHYWGKWEGDMQSTRMHLECADAASDSDLETLPDNTIPRGMTYQEYERCGTCEYCESLYPMTKNWNGPDICPMCEAAIKHGYLDADTELYIQTAGVTA